ncbi:proline--tRNA ligase [Paenibacillus gansuensis]|uniref:Proline--tRNA ligase n=1 Tax=Paenibacillus gansuensis TaxID=306542 RepID=A0ABW5PIA0_9BACL
MKQSKLFVNTLREAPSDAEAVSHQLLLRGGFIRQLAAGVYSYLPLGWRVLRNIERIIREELDRAGAQELLMPALQPAELWKDSGRYDAYGPELIRLRDRHDREFALGPTHEEVITALVKQEIGSYRKMPVTLYQIQTKFRDERRPRFGLLRGREFLMKDAYSFDTSWEGLDHSYRNMYEAYERIFQRCGLNFRAVEADAGAIGGEGETHEFMALAEVGEDTVATCSNCGYAANLEMAKSGEQAQGKNQPTTEPIQKIHTPNVRTIEQLSQFLEAAPQEIMKTLIYMADDQPVAVVIRGDHEVNEIKVKHYLGAETLGLADPEAIQKAVGVSAGFAGPIGMKIPVLVDFAVLQMAAGVCGANETDAHVIHVVPGRDFSIEQTGDFRNAEEGDRCPNCQEGELTFYKGIEVGHVFKLGTKYSDPLGARYLDSNGREQTMIMGCYGIGVSRLLSAIVEQSHDDRGIIWPQAIAPYQVHLIVISTKDEAQVTLANELYETLQRQGMEVLFDDRDERAGIKFNDSDLLGIPYRIVVGKEASNGKVEFVERKNNVKQTLSKEELVAQSVFRTL